jgi:hypothetical protein
MSIFACRTDGKFGAAARGGKKKKKKRVVHFIVSDRFSTVHVS